MFAMKQSIRTIQTPPVAKIIIPGSKSQTNRALLLAALAEGTSELQDILISQDTCAFITALQELGIAIQLNPATQSCMIKGGGGQFPNNTGRIFCEDAGTVARFLLAMCATSPGTYQFDGSEQLRKRPITQLIKILRAQGAKISDDHLPFSLTSMHRLKGGNILVEASETGQFVSALLMAAPFSQSATVIAAENLVSEPYVKMTISMMAEFGVMVRQLHHSRFAIPVPQKYTARKYRIEPDLSTASYFFAAAAVTGGEVTIQPLALQTSKQGDAAFLSVLQKMGCEIKESNTGLTVKGPTALQGINVDMRHFSDTMMTLAAIAPFAKTPTTITNIHHARLKESNRISVMREELEKLAVRVEEGADWLRIYPCIPQAGMIDSHGDHRIAMAFAIMGLRVANIEIEGAECVTKTCPEFFSLWNNLYLPGSA